MADGDAAPSPSPVVVPLFGGALTARVPAGWLDASDVRPVPDNQEVWLADDASGASVVVELLEPPEGVPPDGVAEYLLHDLAQAAGAPAASVGAVAPLTRDAAPCLRCLEGTQGWRAVGAFTAEGGGSGGKGDAAAAAAAASHEVAVALGVVRLPSPLDTDILVTVHAPVLPHGAASGAAGHAGAADAAGAVASALLDGLLASLQIVDFDLFMGGDGDGDGEGEDDGGSDGDGPAAVTGAADISAGAASETR